MTIDDVCQKVMDNLQRQVNELAERLAKLEHPRHKWQPTEITDFHTGEKYEGYICHQCGETRRKLFKEAEEEKQK